MEIRQPPDNPNIKRVAVAIKLDSALAHHIHAFHGIQQYAVQTGRWRVVIDPFAHQRMKEYSGVVARATTSLHEQAKKCGVPVVNIWLSSPVAKHLSCVFPDGKAAGRMAAEHLLSRGLTRFGVLGSRNDKISIGLLAGFRERLIESGFDCAHCNVPHSLFDVPDQWRKGREAITEWIGTLEPPVGVLATRDKLGNMLADLCATEYGIEIPHELALIGTGNEQTYCHSPWMALSSIDLNYHRVGWQAAELLNELMDGAEPPTEPLLVDPGQLIPRQSTDVMTVENAEVAAALRFISDNCDRPIQVQNVADAVATTRRTLQRRFHEHLGRSIKEQIEFLRLERLKRMLINSDEPVKNLAQDCGFSNFTHLYRAFVRAEGMAPNEYRKRRRAGRQPQRAGEPAFGESLPAEEE